MKRIVCCMKSKDSFKRLLNQIQQDNIEWEEFINDIDDIRSKIVYTDYDLAVIDEKLWWKDDVVELFNKKDIDTIFFQGDFEDITNQIKNIFPIEIDSQEISKQVLESSTDLPPEDNSMVKYVELEKKVYIEKEVKVPIYKSVYAGIPNKSVVIVGLNKGAGSTFFTLNLAKYISNFNILATVIEPPIIKPHIYDLLELGDKFNSARIDRNKEFYSYAHVINDNKQLEKDREFIDEGIVWLVPDSTKPVIEKWDYFKMMKLLYSSKKSSISLIDAGNNIDNDSIGQVLDEADLIFVIIDPSLINLKDNTYKLNKFLDMKYKYKMPVEFIINKWDEGINKNILLDYLKVEPFAYLPFIEPKFIYKASYEKCIPLTYPEVRDRLDKTLYRICKHLIPSGLLNNNNVNAHEDHNDKEGGILRPFKIFLHVFVEVLYDMGCFIIQILKYIITHPILLVIIIFLFLVFIGKLNPISFINKFFNII